MALNINAHMSLIDLVELNTDTLRSSYLNHVSWNGISAAQHSRLLPCSVVFHPNVSLFTTWSSNTLNNNTAQQSRIDVPFYHAIFRTQIRVEHINVGYVHTHSPRV